MNFMKGISKKDIPNMSSDMVPESTIVPDLIILQ